MHLPSRRPAALRVLPLAGAGAGAFGTLLLLALAAVAATPLVTPSGALLAQGDPAELGRVYGRTPPAAYFQELARNPRAYQFARAWMRLNPRLRLIETGGDGPPRVELRERGVGLEGAAGVSPASAAASGGPAGTLGRRDGPVEGTFRFPLLLGYYADMASPPPFSRELVQTEFFDGPNSRYGTITEYYAEVSGGRVDLRGVTFDWVQSSLTGAEVTGGVQGFTPPAQVGGFIRDLLAAADAQGVDWGQFDNDGPDGIPNSGDDDGWVDLLAVFHPTAGAECTGGDRVWSHKWRLSGWSPFAPYTTSTPSQSGGNIKVDDYTIQPVYDCTHTEINQIGVFAHELGHGFGLPDLYCTLGTACTHQGIGRWGLMGSGAWGCRSPDDPARPCHMNAWSKHVLGWVETELLPAGADLGSLLLEPVVGSGRVLSVEAADGSGEYFLLENRQRMGFDQSLLAEGLLVWHIDPATVDAYWPTNAVNNNRSRQGVWMRQADGQAWVGSNRGDAGDPFPGATGNAAFHAGSVPKAFTHQGNASGLTLLDIAQAGNDMSFRALTRFQTITLRTENESTGGLLAVDGTGLPGTTASFQSAPFQSHVIAAAAGEPLGPGRRRGFEAWDDDAAAPRQRTVVTALVDAEYVARYGDEQWHLDVAVSGGQQGVVPGALVSTPPSPDLWFAPGTEVSLEAVPTPGFEFDAWTGALTGQPNPAQVTMAAPVSGGATFAFTYALPAELEIVLEAAAPPDVQLTAPSGTEPYVWTVAGGSLPIGLTMLSDGRLAGQPMAVGTFPVQVRVIDDLGLVAVGGLRFEVVPPAVDLATLSGPFTATGAAPSVQQKLFLDLNGNDNGFYDLGDLRAFLRAHGTTLGLATVTPVTSGAVVVPLAPPPPPSPGGGAGGVR